MFEKRFSKWIKWKNHNDAEGIHYPGVYICAISETDLSGKKFRWLQEIVYIGMTNSLSGLKGRLRQFDNTIVGKRGHGGADRVLYKHRDYQTLISKLFFAISPFKCDVKKSTPTDLRIMGEVAKFEYDCFAHFSETFGSLPEFNNKKKSPKYSSIRRKENKK